MGIAENFYKRNGYENSYAVLGVPLTASLTEVKAAYYRLARLYHPDLNPHQRNAEDRLKEINVAYELISAHLMSSTSRRGSLHRSSVKKHLSTDRDLAQQDEMYNTFVDALLGRSRDL